MPAPEPRIRARRRAPRRESGLLEVARPPEPSIEARVLGPVTAPRPLASVPMLLGFAAGVIALIAVVFPTRAEYAGLAEVKQPDQYSIAYLKVLTRANPEDTELRMLYVKQLSQLGRWAEALDALAPALEDKNPAIRDVARLQRFDILLARARSLPEGSADRAAAFDAVAALIPDLVGRNLGEPRMRDLALVALGLDKPGLAAEVYARLASMVPVDQRHEVRATAARWFLAAQNQTQAARYYAWASNTAPTVEKSKEYALLELAALESKNVELAADRSVAYAKKWWDDYGIVERATHLATACDRPRTARDFGRRLVSIGPVTEALQRAQAKRELGAGDPKSALAIVKQLLARRDDCALHEAAARISEWTNDQDTALDHWLWVADHACVPQGVVL